MTYNAAVKDESYVKCIERQNNENNHDAYNAAVRNSDAPSDFLDAVRIG